MTKTKTVGLTYYSTARYSTFTLAPGRLFMKPISPRRFRAGDLFSRIIQALAPRRYVEKGPRSGPVSIRVSIVQPAIPKYRVSLFDRMAEHFGADFTVYASEAADLGILSSQSQCAPWLRKLGPLRRILPGIDWQSGALSIPLGNLDVLVVSGAPRTVSTLILIAKAKLYGVRVIWWGHYWSATSRSWRAKVRFSLMRTTDAIVFYSDQEVQEYRARWGKNNGESVYGLNNGLDTTEIMTLRSPYSAAERSRDLLFIGRVTQKAELGLLLDALCRAACANVTLDVIGDGEARVMLMARADALGIADRLAWHDATIDEKNIAEVMNRCKIFVYPGAAGLSLIHGLAYGLPAIVHDDRWTQMPEIAALRPGVNGVTFQHENADDLARVVAMLLSKSNELEQMSTAALATTSLSFNTIDMAKRFVQAIEGLN